MNDSPKLDANEAPMTAVNAEVAAAEPRLPERQYCVFRAGRERFCFAVLDVEEVVDWPPVTRVPLSPPFMMGIFNLRGAIVPVIDIAFTEGRRADLPPKRVVVAKLKGDSGRDDLRLGIAADEVVGTYTTTEPLLVDEAPRDVPHCCGMFRHPAAPGPVNATTAPEERLALALDLKRLVETFPVGVI